MVVKDTCIQVDGWLQIRDIWGMDKLIIGYRFVTQTKQIQLCFRRHNNKTDSVLWKRKDVWDYGIEGWWIVVGIEDVVKKNK